MDALERIQRLRMALDFAVQSENVLVNLPVKTYTPPEGLARQTIAIAIEWLSAAVSEAERLSKKDASTNAR